MDSHSVHPYIWRISSTRVTPFRHLQPEPCFLQRILRRGCMLHPVRCVRGPHHAPRIPRGVRFVRRDDRPLVDIHPRADVPGSEGDGGCAGDIRRVGRGRKLRWTHRGRDTCLAGILAMDILCPHYLGICSRYSITSSPRDVYTSITQEARKTVRASTIHLTELY